MMNRRRGGRDDLPLTADINVTSLVDVAFTLLVIFIITAPALQGGIEIDIPEADVRPIRTADRSLVVSVDAQGQIWVEETLFDVESFRGSLPGMIGVGDVEIVYLRGDARAPYGTVLQVMGIIETQEGVTLGVVAEPRMEDGG